MKNTKLTTALSTVIFSAAVASTSLQAEIANPGHYKIDQDHTAVQFVVSHLNTANLMGRFNKIEGTIKLDPNGDSSVNVVIPTASVDTNHAKRDKHLRSPDFFNAKQYPEMTFASSNVSYNEAGEPVKVAGRLSLHGKTKDVVLAVKPIGAGNDPWGGYRIGYDATTTIKRSDFGMNYMQGGIGDDVHISLFIEAIKQ